MGTSNSLLSAVVDFISKIILSFFKIYLSNLSISLRYSPNSLLMSLLLIVVHAFSIRVKNLLLMRWILFLCRWTKTAEQLILACGMFGWSIVSERDRYSTLFAGWSFAFPSNYNLIDCSFPQSIKRTEKHRFFPLWTSTKNHLFSICRLYYDVVWI